MGRYRIYKPWKSIVSHTLVSMAFIAFICILAYHIYLKCSKCNACKERVRNKQADSNAEFDREIAGSELARDIREGSEDGGGGDVASRP